MKIAVVVQRYGAEVSGGAELHARYIAEHLARHVEVEVLTTCATDYITWRNALPSGEERVNGITVRRFPVSREREPAEFGRYSEQVFTRPHSLGDELAWLDAEGPTSPALVSHIARTANTVDMFIFFSFRYYHAYHGIRAVADKSMLVPTAERDGALGVSLFAPIFRGVRAVMYNSFEERALIHAVAANAHVPSVVVGVGSEIPERPQPLRFRQKFNLRDRFAIYIGRIDENKGCAELFTHFERYSRQFAQGIHLVLIGHPIIAIPVHPKIHHLGFVGDADKFDALAAADLLVMPSYFESLSMVALEAWALGKPVLANGQCDVLKGQCTRSNAGLYYDNFAEFLETLHAIDFNPMLAGALGRNGREYFGRHYAWPVVERKYLDMLERLRAEPRTTTLEPMPGWWARRRRTLPPADEVVARLPRGAAADGREAASTSSARPTAPAAMRERPRPAPRATSVVASSSPSLPREPASPAMADEPPSTGAPAARPARGERGSRQRRSGGPHQRGTHRYRRPTGRPPRRSGNS